LLRRLTSGHRICLRWGSEHPLEFGYDGRTASGRDHGSGDAVGDVVYRLGLCWRQSLDGVR
jgi:hypothetical protein